MEISYLNILGNEKIYQCSKRARERGIFNLLQLFLNKIYYNLLYSLP